jgi:hypothetical protein
MTAISDLKSLAIRCTKGNELMNFTSEDFQKGQFQTTLVAGLERDKLVTTRKTVAVLGSRGDYLEGVMFCGVGTAGQIPNVDTMFMELMDITGVPAAVQHTVFGEVSPFVTPKEAVNESMLNGIDRQDLSITNSEVIADQAACKTGKTQLVRGTLDSRITFQADSDDIESMSELTLRFRPNSDGVFLMNAGSRVWANPVLNALG